MAVIFLHVLTEYAQERLSESSDYSERLPRGFEFKVEEWGG